MPPPPAQHHRKRGRNSALAETAVRESKSFTEREAVDQKLVDLIAPGDRQLLASLDGRVITRFDGSSATLHTAGAEIVEYQPTLRQKIISAIADPNIALVLLVIGALGIYVEFSSPGLIVPGVLGGILVLLALSALTVLPINWLGGALMLLAFTLFVLEVKFTSHGILGAGGALAMVLGAVMLVDSPVPELRVRWSTAIALTLPFSAITVFLLTIAARARRNKVETGVEGMIGLIGTAMTNLVPEGKVFVHGEYWDAIAVRPADAGAHVKITAIDGLKLTVEPRSEASYERSESVLLIFVLVVAIWLLNSIKILREYERGVIFRLGRLLPEPKGPGLVFVFAPFDRMVRVSLRLDALEVPAQDVVTRDNVTVKVNAVIYSRVLDPRLAVVEVTNYVYVTSQLAQTTLRSVLGEVELDELLSQREKLNVRLQSILDQHTSAWSVKVDMGEVNEVDLAEQMIRALSRQAEAERERRAKIIHAEGEFTAAAKLAMAAEVIQKEPAAIQLRYLQTLVEIGAEKNTTIVFPLPLDIIASLGRALDRAGNGGAAAGHP